MKRLVILAGLLVLASVVPSAAWSQAAAQSGLVPQNLLGLVHAPEIHAELGLSDQQVRQLEDLFATIDGDWFRARIRPAEEQYATLGKLESRVREWFLQNASPAQATRLQELELQSQGTRCLLRQDVATKLQLDKIQQSQLLDLANKVAAAQSALQKATLENKSQAIAGLNKRLANATKAEQQAARKIVKPEQIRMFTELIGKPFDTSKLERIYPMAPEFVPVDDWINSAPLTLKELRGKVVLVHFYAYQCHNCHANFDHYAAWHEKFPSDEVVVIGIQTPETRQERDPQLVRTAAQEKGMQYPVMIDLESKNWQAWANTMWPTVYVVDKNGYLRHWWQGELNWQGATADKTIEDVVTKLRQE